MATFFVGHRVRFVRARTAEGQRRVGSIGTIIALGDDLLDCYLDPAEAYIEYFDGDRAAVMRWQIEPIQYDGMKPVAWSECLWQPEGVAA